MHHFDQHEFRDFTGGLWTLGDWLVPENGAQELLDCYPLPQGGIRAFPKFSELPNAGIGVDERPTGLYSRGGIPRRDGSPTEDSDHYLMTYAADDTPRLYRLDETVVPTPTSWSLIKSFAGGDGGTSGSIFASYFLTSDVTHVYVVVAYVGGDRGLHRIRYSDGQVTKIDTGGDVDDQAFYVTVHQNRLVVGSEAANGSRIRWSDPGTETFQAASSQDVEPQQPLAHTAWLHPFAPSDLLIMKNGAPAILLQGDITDPILRAMGNVRHMTDRGRPAELEEGLAFIAFRDGVYATPDGSSQQKLSEPIAASDIAQSRVDSYTGDLTYLGNWLFTPTGHVYDTRTEAWFRHSRWSNSSPALHMAVDKHVDEWRFRAAQQPAAGQAPRIFSMRPEESSSPRMSTYTVKTVPIRHPTGRQVTLRRVEVYLRPVAGSGGGSCTVTVKGTPRSKPYYPGSKPQKLTFDFVEMDEVLDVTVQPDSGDPDVEAPILEVVKVHTLPGHLR